MAYLTTRAEPEIKAAFHKRAAAKGLKESELLRRLVLAELGKSEPKLFANLDLKKIDSNRITVRMPLFLLDAAKARAKAKGMAPSRWITALVQSHLTNQPVMVDAQLVELRASNRELAAIGRNINQIAKAINEVFYDTERLRLDKLAEVMQCISENREAIRALVRASQHAWGGD